MTVRGVTRQEARVGLRNQLGSAEVTPLVRPGVSFCSPTLTMSSQESYLVIGGCGFLGRNIVEALLARGELQVAVFDLVQRHFDTNVQFFTGDIADETAVSNAIQKVRALPCIVFRCFRRVLTGLCA